MFWTYIFRKKPDDPHKHDWEMKFPDENSMEWIFVCSKCGAERSDMPSPYELMK